MSDFLVSVMARDRVGIVADVTTALRDLGGNITHLNQTVVRDHFTILLSAQMPAGATAEKIRARVESAAPAGELCVGVMPYQEQNIPARPPAERFVLAILGRDRPGIIARVTAYLAEAQINIEDFSASVVDGDLVLIFSVSIPASLEIPAVQRAIEQVGEEFGIRATLQHENIFRATSEVRAVRTLRRRN